MKEKKKNTNDLEGWYCKILSPQKKGNCNNSEQQEGNKNDRTLPNPLCFVSELFQLLI